MFRRVRPARTITEEQTEAKRGAGPVDWAECRGDHVDRPSGAEAKGSGSARGKLVDVAEGEGADVEIVAEGVGDDEVGDVFFDVFEAGEERVARVEREVCFEEGAVRE